MGACPVCGATGTQCGDPYTGQPIDVVNLLERNPPMSDNNEMLRVEIKPGDVRRVNPRDKDTFMAANPGAKILSGDKPSEESEGAESKMVEQAPSNKAQTMGTVGKK